MHSYTQSTSWLYSIFLCFGTFSNIHTHTHAFIRSDTNQQWNLSVILNQTFSGKMENRVAFENLTAVYDDKRMNVCCAHFAIIKMTAYSVRLE